MFTLIKLWDANQLKCMAHLFSKPWWSSKEVAYSVEDGGCYAIHYHGNFVGLIVTNMDVHRNGRAYLKIDFIEFTNEYKGRGLFRPLLRYLFEGTTFGKRIYTIYGESTCESIPAWYRVGADFEMSDSKLGKYIEEGYSACFKLTIQRFKKGR